MKHSRRNAGFTLIELMIVVAIIAIIASVAIPRLLSARLAANESAAISTLRSISSAQAQLQSSGAIDSDADGGGEYGYLAELAGTFPLRVSAAGLPAAGANPVDLLTPSVLSAAFGQLVAGQPLVTRSGYVFQIWLPAAGPAPVAGVAEDNGPAGGKAGAPFPGSNNNEVLWNAYAWPINASQTGNRVFFVSQDGDVLQTLNRVAAPYSGAVAAPGVTTPNFDAPYTVAGDMSSPLAIGAAGVAADGRVWTVVQ